MNPRTGYQTMQLPPPDADSAAQPVSQPARIPLRERKFYQTRLRLARALRERLDRVSLDELNVRDLCEEVEVSEATFFNYFPKKSDLLAYLGQLWSVELAWHGRQALARGESGLTAVQRVFEQAARQFQAAPGVAGELIAWQARARARHAPEPLSTNERRLAFPDQAGIEALADQSLEQALVAALQRAIDQGELPRNTHLPIVMVALLSIFHGVPLALRLGNPAGVGAMYRQQLAILWGGVRQAAEGRG